MGYSCDNWVIIRLNCEKPYYKLLTGTSGGYLDGDSWRMNSGITEIEKEGDYYLVKGVSGSVYRCHKNSYRLRMNNAQIWTGLKERNGAMVDMLDEDEWKQEMKDFMK